MISSAIVYITNCKRNLVAERYLRIRMRRLGYFLGLLLVHQEVLLVEGSIKILYSPIKRIKCEMTCRELPCQ